MFSGQTTETGCCHLDGPREETGVWEGFDWLGGCIFLSSYPLYSLLENMSRMT